MMISQKRRVKARQRFIAALRLIVKAVLNRGHEGTESVNYNEDVQAFLKKGLAASRWSTAVQAQQQLESHFGRRFR